MKKLVWSILVLLGALVLGGYVAIYAHKTYDVFTLEASTVCNSVDCDYQRVAQVAGSQLPGIHRFRLKDLTSAGETAGHHAQWAVPVGNRVETRMNAGNQNVLWSAPGCEFSLSLKSQRFELNGIGALNEDGFGPVENFKSYALEAGHLYYLGEFEHQHSTSCYFTVQPPMAEVTFVLPVKDQTPDLTPPGSMSPVAPTK